MNSSISKLVRTARLLVGTATLMWVTCTPATAAEFNAWFTKELVDGIPGAPQTRAFSCNDTVHAVLDMIDTGDRERTVEVHWIDPSGKLRETTTIPFHGSTGVRTVWSWLKMHAPAGSSLGQLVDSSFGMTDFIGEWTVRFLLDGKRAKEANFNVLC